MAIKLYVGGLPYSTKEPELKELFAPYGTIENVSIIKDRESGRSKGFGFVEMTNPDEAQAAIAALHEHDLGGRYLAVNEARPMESRKPGDAKKRTSSNDRPPRRY